MYVKLNLTQSNKVIVIDSPLTFRACARAGLCCATTSQVLPFTFEIQMFKPMKTLALMAAMVLASGASLADPCDDLMAQIDAKIRATGMLNFSLTLVDAAAVVPGRGVGSCARGTRKIVYAAGEGSVPALPALSGAAANSGTPAPASPFKTQVDGILTECKDGSIAYGPDCRKPPPVARRVVARAASVASGAASGVSSISAASSPMPRAASAATAAAGSLASSASAP